MADTKINIDSKHAVGAAAAWKLGDTIRATGSLLFIVFTLFTLNGLFKEVERMWTKNSAEIEAKKAVFDEWEVYKVQRARCYASIPWETPEWQILHKKEICDRWARNEMYNLKARALQRVQQKQPLTPGVM